MRLSVVTSLYKSSPYIRPFYERIVSVTKEITDDYEIVFVNDGSPDDSLSVVHELYKQNPDHIVIIDLSRNFGHHPALMTGIAHATGDLIYLTDVDLEEPPELLSRFHKELEDQFDADVIYGQAAIRDGDFIRQITGDLYYRLLRRLTGLNIPQNLLMTRLMSRRYARHLVMHQERRYSIEGLWELTGYKQVGITVDKKYKGETTYTLRRRIALAVNGVTSLSNKPLVYIAYLGVFLALPSFLYILYALFMYFFGGSGVVEGWTTIVASVWFLGGLNIFVLGIIAVYLSVLFDEVKQRPYTVVREIRHNQSARDALFPDLVQNPE